MAKAKKLSHSKFPRFFLLFAIALFILIIGFALGALYYQAIYGTAVRTVNRRMIGHTVHIPSNKEIAANWQVYTNPTSGLKIHYPADWTQTTSTNFLRIAHTPSAQDNYGLQMNFTNRAYDGTSLPIHKTQYIKEKQQNGMQVFAACDCEIANLHGFQVNGYYLDQKYQAASYETDFILIDAQKKREYEFVFTHTPQSINVDDLVGKIISSISY